MQDGQQIEVWRGVVTPWRCDEMGHMNLRFYLAIAEEGLAGLAAALGQPQAFVREAASTLRVRRHHVRYLREARLGDALYATAGVLEMSETEARLLQVIRHADGTPSAALVTTAAHSTPAGRAFAWSQRAREGGDRLRCVLPDFAAPRSVTDDPPPLAGKARADALGLLCIGRGALAPADCDVFGDMTSAAILGRVSDGAPLLTAPLRDAMARAYPDVRVGSAVLEFRIDVRRKPRAGDLLELRSGVARIEDKVMHVRHWLLDPLDGSAYAIGQAVAASLDLDARRILPMPAQVRHLGVTPGLA